MVGSSNYILTRTSSKMKVFNLETNQTVLSLDLNGEIKGLLLATGPLGNTMRVVNSNETYVTIRDVFIETNETKEYIYTLDDKFSITGDLVMGNKPRDN